MLLAVPVRTTGELPYRIREIRLRFFAADTMFQPTPEVGLCPPFFYLFLIQVLFHFNL